jgi:hypothetical protein
MTIDSQSMLSGSPPLAVKLNFAQDTWTAYMADIILAENLPLFADSEKPIVKLRAGTQRGSMALLKEFTLKEPSHHSDSPVKTVDGRVDLAAEYAKGTPGVGLGSKSAGKPNNK